MSSECNEFSRRLATAVTLHDLEAVAAEIAQAKLDGASWTRNDESMAIMRIVYKTRRDGIMLIRECAPHNDPDNWEWRDDIAYCKTCKKYIGRKGFGGKLCKHSSIND